MKKLSLLVLVFILALVLSQCPRGQNLLGGVCRTCSQVNSPAGSYYVYRDYCMHKPPSNDEIYNKTLDNSQKFDASKCLGEDVISMFFSWVSYSDDLDMLISKWFSESDGYPRIKGCGRWLSVNSFHKSNSIYITSHVYFFINPELKKVVMAHRGTNFNFADTRTWIDWFGNLYIILKECPFVDCGKVHYGFKTTYNIHKFELLQQAAEYLEKGYELIITGHSQGASVSQIAFVHFNEHFKNYSTKIKNYSFATPRTGNKDFAKAYDKLKNAGNRYSAVAGYTRDVVTAIPPEIMFYKHTSKEIIVPCQSKYFGNPNPPKDIRIRGLFPSLVPATIGCHYHQVYMDGLIDMKGGLKNNVDQHSISNKIEMEQLDMIVDGMLKNL